jgi:adenylate cyclase
VTDATTRAGESTWTKLRRRKVVQWGIAYVAGAWGLLQGLEYASSTFDWPRQFLQLATIGLLIGLPIVLVLAWYHGDKGEQRVTRVEFAIITLLFLLGGGLFWRFEHASAPASVAVDVSTAPEAASPIPTDHSIAVLPFVNMSSDKDQEYFADGISEELLNLLAQVPQLRVIARTSSFSFKGKEVDIATIAEKLNVANVLEGSVRKSGDTIRITAQLVRASDSSHLWSQTYDRQMTDVFKVQDEIAAAVVEQLKIKLLADAPKSRATDPNAYALFLQAREVGRRNTEAAYQQSIALYQQALALDPAYAAAWVGLASVYCDQVNNGLQLADEGVRLAREAIAKALELDPDYAPARAQLAWIAIYYDRDLAAAARYLELALAQEPANPDIIGTAGILARRLGRLDQAIAIAEYLVSGDPVDASGYYDLGLAYRYAGRLNAAIAEFRTGLGLSPGYANAHATIGAMLLQKGDARAALAETLQEASEQFRMAELSNIYYALGRRSESDAAITDLIRKYEKTSAVMIAGAMAYRGDASRAFEWLDKAVRYHDPSLGAIADFPSFANIHSDPRWLPFLRKIGLAPEQLAAIKIDVRLPN